MSSTICISSRDPENPLLARVNPQTGHSQNPQTLQPGGNFTFAIAVQRDPVTESIPCGACVQPLEAAEHKERPAACNSACELVANHHHGALFSFMQNLPTGNEMPRTLVELAALHIGTMSASDAARVELIMLSECNAHTGEKPLVKALSGTQADKFLCGRPDLTLMSALISMRERGVAGKSALFVYPDVFGGSAWTEVRLERRSTYCDNCHKFGETDAQQCSFCKDACYCSRDCQKAAWSAHKYSCREIQLKKRAQDATEESAKTTAEKPEFLDNESDSAPMRAHKCAACQTFGVKTKRCIGCMAVRYCSAECQRANWADHRTACKATRERATTEVN